MPVITIASTKGGVGKSTLAVNLSAQFAKQGHDVALLDADPQGSAFKWNTVRQAVIDEGTKLSPIFVASVQGQTLLDLSKEKSDQGYYVFIDSAGVDNQSTRSALVRSDYVLMVAAPFHPGFMGARHAAQGDRRTWKGTEAERPGIPAVQQGIDPPQRQERLRCTGLYAGELDIPDTYLRSSCKRSDCLSARDS